ncbi:MAG: HEAT repeat domain-containing protein [Candidatus Odinarchaeota archaeon]
MELIPRKIYENFICEKISKNETVNLLLTLIENVDDDVIRNESIDTLNKLDFIDLKVFKILEDILISEQNQRLRYSAAQVLRKKFINKCLEPFIWTLQHETSYDVLITVIKSLKETGDNKIVSALINKLTLISSHDMGKDTFPSFTQNLVEKPSLEYLVEILINLVTLIHLKKKFQNLLFKIENGFLILRGSSAF